MNAGKRPVRLSNMSHARATWHTLHPEAGDLPRVFVLEFRDASGPAPVSDGRALLAVVTPAELADVLGALPLLSLARDDDDIRAYKRITRLLKGESQS